MKKEFFIVVFIFITLIIPTIAEKEEFSIRFHSFGKNATIDLRTYLGESVHYIVSETENVIVTIDQSVGTAYLEAKPGWNGTETVFFRRIESKAEVVESKPEPNQTQIEPIVLDDIKEKPITYKEPPKFLENIIDESLADMLDDIKKEEIKKLTKVVEGDSLKLNVNDEIEFNLEVGSNPTVTMDFSLGPKQENGVEEEIDLENETMTAVMINIITIILVAGMIYLFWQNKRFKNKKNAKGQERKK